MICSSVYRLFFIPSPPVQITRELHFSLADFFGGNVMRDLQPFPAAFPLTR